MTSSLLLCPIRKNAFFAANSLQKNKKNKQFSCTFPSWPKFIYLLVFTSAPYTVLQAERPVQGDAALHEYSLHRAV